MYVFWYSSVSEFELMLFVYAWSVECAVSYCLSHPSQTRQDHCYITHENNYVRQEIVA